MGGLKKREMDNEGSESDAPPVRLEREDNEAVPLMMSTGALKDVCCTHRERERERRFQFHRCTAEEELNFVSFVFGRLYTRRWKCLLSTTTHTHTVHQSS